ncbi:hypothetical protein FZEAL_1673 [Fusarium zealandicum]|uniref:Uncharacterized protein n=1 Tax=Fusarium zealandicum TaxID=1053134 RepID=A0A8H4USU8_9HYPO|nr:hypothetical protein FZEAL_1673 [Fusarium zealandicum]
MATATAQLETRAGARLEQDRQGSLSTGAPPKPHDPPVGQAKAGATTDEDGQKEGVSVKGRLEPSSQFTSHQLFYVFFLDGIGGMAVSGGVNFALAYFMYTTQDTTKNPIRLFQLPNTLAGDAAVTIIIQCVLTWFVEMGLVSYDLSRRSVQPIGFIPEPLSPRLRWLFFLPPSDSVISTDKDKPKDQPKAESRFASIVSFAFKQALRGFFLALVGFFLLWPIGVGVLTAFGDHTGGDYVYKDRWVPQAFKAILGGLLGLLTTPLMALFWLIKAGWEDRKQRVRAPEP